MTLSRTEDLGNTISLTGKDEPSSGEGGGSDEDGQDG